jgi:cytochrome P450
MVFNALGPRNRLFELAFENSKPVQAWITDHCREQALTPDGLGAEIHRVAAAQGVSTDDACLLVRSTLSAGIDTTVNALGSAINCFVRHPGQWEILRQDLSLAKNAFEEVLRYEGTAHSFYRTTTRRVVIGDLSIPASTKILVLLAGANRDGAKFPQPDQFLIDRNNRGHVGFGLGIHGCVGRRLAEMEGELVLSALAKRVRRFELTSDPVYRLNNSLRGLASLPVRVELN